ncbi:hypothetical protein ACFOWA_19915 [Pedobacter lithocola]|uniref:AAA domain-containing protein n=1 Tax=Pedobacter lithocola TaxID=1908239 RepID=A0ABV8PHD9_9SPHI
MIEVREILSDVAAGEAAEAPEQEFDALAAFGKSILDQKRDYPLPQPLMHFVQNGKIFPHRTKKSFSLQQGKQKSKKTTELAMEVAAYINNYPVNEGETIYFECVEPGVVLFFDNEQGESYAARTMKLILALANLKESDRLIYCDLREFRPKERKKVIAAGVKSTPNVKWVIVDGIVDVMDDFMSAEEGHLVITDLLKLSSQHDIHVTGVLHQNKGASKEARAHVGSIAGQKCEMEIMVERDTENKNLSVVSAKETRGLPFEDFAIIWEEGALPRIVQDWSASNSNNTGSLRQMVKKQKDWEPNDYPVYFHLIFLHSIFAHYPDGLSAGDFKKKMIKAWPVLYQDHFDEIEDYYTRSTISEYFARSLKTFYEDVYTKEFPSGKGTSKVIKIHSDHEDKKLLVDLVEKLNHLFQPSTIV